MHYGGTMSTITDKLFLDAEWTITCEWDATESGAYLNAPSRIVIEPSPSAPAESRHKGITSTVMRRIERAVTEHAAERRKSFPVVKAPKFWDVIRERIRQMPEGPRDRSGDYYAELLDLYEILDATEPHAAERLAIEIGKPVNTVLSQLQRARQRAKR